MQPLNLKPSHKLVKSYYETLGNYGPVSYTHLQTWRNVYWITRNHPGYRREAVGTFGIAQT